VWGLVRYLLEPAAEMVQKCFALVMVCVALVVISCHVLSQPHPSPPTLSHISQDNLEDPEMSLECRDEIQQDDVSSQAQPAAQLRGRAAAVAAPLGSLHAQPTILNSTNQIFSAPYPTVPQTWTRTHTHKHPTHHNPPPVCDIHELPPQLPPAGGLCRRRDQPVCRSVQPLLAHPSSHLPWPTAATSPCTLPSCAAAPLTVPPSCTTTPLWAEAKALCASEKQCQGGVLDCLRSKQDEIKGEECRNEVFSALQMQVTPRRWRTLQGC
jgi:hypothetical protein